MVISAAKCQQEMLLDGTARAEANEAITRPGFCVRKLPYIYFNKPAIQQEADDGVVVERASHETF